MTSNTKNQIVELTRKLYKHLLKYAGKDTDTYKLHISSEDYNIIKEFDDICAELRPLLELDND
jgi:hypothetical protein